MAKKSKNVAAHNEKLDTALHKPDSESVIPDGYMDFLAHIKQRIQAAQVKAILSVNSELIKLYWHIGGNLSQKEHEEGWGAKVIERLARDLKSSFPDRTGFSKRNLLYMRQFSDAYPDFEITQQLVAQIPWGHNVILLTKVKNSPERFWYAQKTI